MLKSLLIILCVAVVVSCQAPPQRNCELYKEGSFSFTTTINGQEETTFFKRKGNLEIEVFNAVNDTSSVRWINNCEYVLRKLKPKNKAEEKSIHIKILTTTDSSYIFEYAAVGAKKKFRGTAIKQN